MDRQVAQIHHVHGEALALDADGSAAAGLHGGDDVQVHTAGQDPAVLVVGVVAADLRAARGGEQGAALRPAKGLLQAADQPPVPLQLPRSLLPAVELLQRGEQFFKISHRSKRVSHKQPPKLSTDHQDFSVSFHVLL